MQMTLQIFVPCYFGHVLETEFATLSSSLYSSGWTEGDRSIMKSTNFFMLNLNKTVKIHTFGVFDVNLHTFVRIINFTFSLYAVLKRLK